MLQAEPLIPDVEHALGEMAAQMPARAPGAGRRLGGATYPGAHLDGLHIGLCSPWSCCADKHQGRARAGTQACKGRSNSSFDPIEAAKAPLDLKTSA